MELLYQTKRKDKLIPLFIYSALVKLTPEQEKKLLLHIVPGYEKRVKSALKVDLLQHQFDALVCFAYNSGGRFNTLSCAEEKPNTVTDMLPTTLIGTWQVTGVCINAGSARKMNYQHDDPRLTGRIFTMDTHKITTNARGEKLCVNPKVITHRTTASELIKNSMGGQLPTLKDFELPFSDNEPVVAFTLSCKDGLFGGSMGPVDGIEGAWIIALRNGQLAMHWYDDTIFLLNGLPKNAKPAASFNCNKAATVVEKTICGSVALAAFDQSVAQAYKFAGNFFKEVENPEALTRLKISQKQWLNQRNGCGADAQCLEKSMEDRLEAIETTME